MTSHEVLTRATALCSFVLYVFVLTVFLQPRVRRLVWTAACVVYLVHVLCAFQFVHHWSHAAALAATARQTTEVVGLDWGGGLYANYAFTIVWCADVCWWWLFPTKYETRLRPIEWAVQLFLGFLWFNATVVFGHGISRVVGVAAWLLMLASWFRQVPRPRKPAAYNVQGR